MPSSLELPSPAKINLWLRILGKRGDGFHEVQTRLCQVGIADTVNLVLKGDGRVAKLTCNQSGVPLDETNLALKALRAFEQRVGLKHS